MEFIFEILIMFLGPRNVIARHSLLPLMCGIAVGFMLSYVFMRSPSRPYWMPYGGEVKLKDPQVDNDLAYAVGVG